MPSHSPALPVLGALTLLVPAAAQSSLTTTFATNNNLNAPGSNLFDLAILNPQGIVITSLDVNCQNVRNGPVGTPFTIEVYMTDAGGTYVGNQTNASVWHLVSTGSGISLPQGTPTPVDIADVFLPQGSFGMAVQYTTVPAPGTAFAYTSGANTYGNADLTITLGSSCTGLFAGPVYDPRTWNGTIHYQAGSRAAYGVHGRGCDGGSTNGVPTLAPDATNPVPALGAQFDLVANNLGSTVTIGVVMLSTNLQTWGAWTLPYELSLLGMPGCRAYLSPDAQSVFVNVGTGTATFTILVPNNPVLAGLTLGTQAVHLDPLTTNPLGASMTNLAAGRVGT